MKRNRIFATIFACVILASCSSSKKVEPTAPDSDASQKAESQNNIENQKPRDMDKLTKVLFKTSEGDITIALYDDTPKHKENFIKLVNDNFYKDVLFHRIIKGFMIQTGDPDSKNAAAGKMLGSGGPGYTIPAEIVPRNIHKRGAVAAARLADQVNPKKESSGSQFYIVDGQVTPPDYLNQIAQQTGKEFNDEQTEIYTTIGGAPFLDGDYTVFGEVVSGMEVVDKIASAQKDQRDRPVKDIKIISAEVIK